MKKISLRIILLWQGTFYIFKVHLRGFAIGIWKSGHFIKLSFSEPLTNLTNENDTIHLCYGEMKVVVNLIEEERRCTKYDWCASFEKESSCESHCHAITGKLLITIYVLCNNIKYLSFQVSLVPGSQQRTVWTHMV